MASTIYATFSTENDAERASGALMDHGIDKIDISYVISDIAIEPVLGPVNPLLVQSDTSIPAHVPLPGTFTESHIPEPPIVPDLWLPHPAQKVHASPEVSHRGYRYDALGAVIEDINRPNAEANRDAAAIPMPGDVTLDMVEQDAAKHESRDHSIDMHRKLTGAAKGISTTTAADAAKGSMEGASIGVGLGILLGLAAVAIPGVGLVAGTGMLVAGLAAATGAAGGIAGGVYGYLSDLGLSSDRVRFLSDHLDSGGLILSINVTGVVSESEIVRILEKYGATSAEGY